VQLSIPITLRPNKKSVSRTGFLFDGGEQFILEHLYWRSAGMAAGAKPDL